MVFGSVALSGQLGHGHRLLSGAVDLARNEGPRAISLLMWYAVSAKCFSHTLLSLIDHRRKRLHEIIHQPLKWAYKCWDPASTGEEVETAVYIAVLTFCVVWSGCFADWVYAVVVSRFESRTSCVDERTENAAWCQALVKIVTLLNLSNNCHFQRFPPSRVVNIALNLEIAYQAWNRIGDAETDKFDVADELWFALSVLSSAELALLFHQYYDRATKVRIPTWKLLVMIDASQLLFETVYLSCVEAESSSYYIIIFNCIDIVFQIEEEPAAASIELRRPVCAGGLSSNDHHLHIHRLVVTDVSGRDVRLRFAEASPHICGRGAVRAIDKTFHGHTHSAWGSNEDHFMRFDLVSPHGDVACIEVYNRTEHEERITGAVLTLRLGGASYIKTLNASESKQGVITWKVPDMEVGEKKRKHYDGEDVQPSKRSRCQL